MNKQADQHIRHAGNFALMDLPKTAFLCSRRVPASIILKSYDWAIARRENNRCIISGFHSQIEKDVLHYLLKGPQPVIVALARGLKKRIEPQLADAITKNKLLVITPFEQTITRANQATANRRNELMAELADEIFVAYAKPNGNIESLVLRWLKKGKTTTMFDVEENRKLIEAGATPRFV
jgi:predicted Rossmann fold nucleotide-binding protein DprA/Smf involved in DNA uptake